MEHYVYFALTLGRPPPYDGIAMPPAVFSAIHETQMEILGGPGTAPGLEVKKAFYGRAVWRPDDLSDAVAAIGADCMSYMLSHPGIVPVRLEHYNGKFLERWPRCKQEADARPIHGDPDMMEPDDYLVQVRNTKTNEVEIIRLHACSAVDAVQTVYDELCFNGEYGGLHFFGRPRLARKNPGIIPDACLGTTE